MSIDDYLKNVYYSPENPSSYGGLNLLYEDVKKAYPNVKKNRIKEWLEKQYTYTLHRNARKNFIRNRIYVTHIDENWEADICDMQEFSKENNGYKYILTVIDVLSKYLWAKALKNKSSTEVVSAFKEIITERKPTNIRTDRGLEFENSVFKKFCQENNIRHYTSQDKKIKCSVVERVNRTLKEKMFRYFTSNGTRKYVDVLDKLVYSYNNRFHRSIKMKPADVNESTENIAYHNLYKDKTLKNLYLNKKNKSTHLPIGSTVRKTYELSPFDKSYYPLWTDETFKISNVINRPYKPQYIIENFKGENLKRKFYKEEIQKINSETEYRIEKIIRKRKRNNKIEYFVKWLGYPNTENQWITGSDLIFLKAQRVRN